MNHSGQIRTFIAFEVPSDIKEIARNLQDELRAVDCRVSWTRPQGMHLTLKFLGDTDIGLVEEIGGAIEEIAAVHPPFTMRLERAGAFGGKNPRVLWLGFADSEPLTQLQREIDRAMAQFGFPREQRRFHAHLTLCRIKDSRGAGELVECLKSCGFEPVSFQAKEVIFYKSELKPTGAVYTPLKIVEFKAED